MKKIKIGYSEISTSQLGQMEKYGVLRKNLEILSVFLSFCLQDEKRKKAKKPIIMSCIIGKKWVIIHPDPEPGGSVLAS